MKINGKLLLLAAFLFGSQAISMTVSATMHKSHAGTCQDDAGDDWPTRPPF